jgi:nucleoside-diphosphate-sugar epimerase
MGRRIEITGAPVLVETTVVDLARTLRALANRQDQPIRYEPARRGPSGDGRNFASYKAARENLRFEPRIRLREGLARTWQWFLEHAPSPLPGRGAR